MFVRLVYESFRRQKRRKVLAGAAIALGVTVTTAMIAVATDVGDKINRELRTIGANLIVTPQEDSLDVEIGGVNLTPPSDGAYLDEADLPKIKGIFWHNNITGFAPMLPVLVTVVHTEPFMRDELVLITPADFESAHFSSQQLLASSLLMREQGSGSRHVVETALEKAGYKLKAFRRVMDLDSTEAIKSAVEAGLGIGFVSRWAITKELELGALKIAQVRGLQIARHFSLLTRSGPEMQGPSEAFRIFALGRGHLLTNLRKPRHSKVRAR